MDDVNLDLRKGEVLSLVGENGAGKSTLMRIILGETLPDAGEMILRGEPHVPKSPHDALKSGISMIHQELSLIPHTTVAENIWIGRDRDFSKFGMIDAKKRYKATAELLSKFSIPVNPKDIVSNLSVAKMQLVEIARAISYHSDIIIMDEATSSLTSQEIDLLKEIIKKLTSEGTSIIFITHKLDEVLEISDRISVLRDGRSVGSCQTKDTTKETLINMIVGHAVKEMFPKYKADIGDVVLEARDLCSIGQFKDVSFNVRKGEIVGFSGLVGAGRTEVMRAVFGIDRITSGEIFVDGKKVNIRSTKDAINLGMGFVTEDRRGMGLFSILSVRMNAGMSALKMFFKFIYYDKKKEAILTDNVVKTMNIKISSPHQQIATLSGGNQQKVIIGRCLLRNVKILILDEPTKGIDVGSKSEIHRHIGELAQKGMAVILVSSELPEVMGISDRIYVMRNGRINGEFKREEFSQERLITTAFGGVTNKEVSV